MNRQKLPPSPVLAPINKAPPHIPQVPVPAPRPLRLTLLPDLEPRPQLAAPELRRPVERALALLAYQVRQALARKAQRVRVGLDGGHDGVRHARGEEAGEGRCVGVPLGERGREGLVERQH